MAPTSSHKRLDFGLIEFDSAGHCRAVNAQACRMLSVERTDLIGTTVSGRLAALLPEQFVDMCTEVAASGEVAELEQYDPTLDRWLQATVGKLSDGLLVRLRDVSFIHQQKREIDRLTRLYAMLSRINQAVVRLRSDAELPSEVCRAFVEQGGFLMAWIGARDAASERILPFAADGKALGYLAEIVMRTDDSPHARGPAGVAFRTGRAVVCNDFLHDPTTAPWHEAAARYGIAASVCLAIRRGGQISGIIGLYSDEVGAFEAREVELLEEAAADVSFALDLFDQEADRKRAESHARLLAAIVESSQDAIIGTTLDGIIESWNRAAEMMFGVRADDVVGRDIARVLPPDQCEEALLRSTREDGLIHNYETRRWRGDGQEFHCSVTISPIRGPDDGIIGLSRIMHDITALREGEQALSDLNDRLDLTAAERLRLLETQSVILNALPAHVALIDHDGVIVAINDAWRHFGTDNGLASKDFCVGQNYLEITRRTTGGTGIETGEILHGIRRVLAGEISTFGLEYPCHSDTEQRWFSLTVTPLRDQSVSGAVIMHVDVTERMEAKLKLRESEERFRQLAENIDEVFWIFDPLRNRTLYVSPAYEKIWGRSCQSVYDQSYSWFDAIDPEQRRAVQSGFALRAATGEYDETFQITRPDGSRSWIRDRAFPLRNSDGVVYRVVGIAEDITEQRKIEAQFLRAQRLESIGTLAGGIAHDLNNVLAPIMLSIAFLQMGEADPQKLEILETIETSARHGADMVKQVLTFARGTDGERISLQIRDIVNDVVKIARETFQRNIEIRASLPSDLWRVNGDPSQLHRVLLNLVVNARDAMPQGGKIGIAATNRIIETPDLALNPDAKLGPAVMLEIEDTGAGMTAEVLAKIFDPFFTTKERGRGTGLGLSTSLSIIKSHGGFVRADSEPGRGSRFSICLPAESSAKPAITAEKAADLPRGQGQLVLLVDDEPNVLSVTSGTLKAFGYRVITAVDGADAVGVFASHKDEVAVVLTDMMMPVMDGLATARVLRRMRPHVPIILSSGLGGEGRMGQATEAGIRDFLHKPYTADTLLKSLAEVLRPYDPDEDSDDDD